MSPLSVLDEQLAEGFTPSLMVINAYRTPRPILPINFSFFLRVELPRFTGALPLPSQLLIAKRATEPRRSYPFPGPFGRPLGFVFHRSRHLTIYLNPEGEFDS